MNAADDIRFNRHRLGGQVTYLDEVPGGFARARRMEYAGHIKVKLLHGLGYSLVIPEQIYADLGGSLHWFQPLHFSGNRISFLDEFAECSVHLNIASREELVVTFRKADLQHRYPDGSFLYDCNILGPQHLDRYRTGDARFIDGRPHLRLYHHTDEAAKASIEASAEFRTTNWNLQGTKRFDQIAFLYLTPLPSISTRADLEKIAMSSAGRLGLRLDGNNSMSPEKIIKVYRASTDDRESTIEVWADATHLSTQPCWRHRDDREIGYHEIMCPFVQRLGAVPGTLVGLDGGVLTPRVPKGFDFAVVGDCSTNAGLVAPFDEENTPEKLLVQQVHAPDDLFDFWRRNANQDLYDQQSRSELHAYPGHLARAGLFPSLCVTFEFVLSYSTPSILKISIDPRSNSKDGFLVSDGRKYAATAIRSVTSSGYDTISG